MTSYELLGCSSEATDAAIRYAFHDLSKKYHPDKMTKNEKVSLGLGKPTASAQTKVDMWHQLQQAYNAIKTPERRAKYDKQLAMLHPPAKCTTCNGSKFIQSRKGFKVTEKPCPDCK